MGRLLLVIFAVLWRHNGGTAGIHLLAVAVGGPVDILTPVVLCLLVDVLMLSGVHPGCRGRRGGGDSGGGTCSGFGAAAVAVLAATAER